MSRVVTEEDFRMPEFRGKDPKDYEFRPDGKVVRKDRWENAIHHIRHALGDERREFETSDIVGAVWALVATIQVSDDDENTYFGNMSEAEYLDEFRKGLWHVDGIDDVVKYAARMAAYYGGGMQHDGIGLLSESHSTHPRVPDVKFKEIDDWSEEEILAPAEGAKGQ